MVPQRINATETHQNIIEIPGKLSESLSYQLTDTNNWNKKRQKRGKRNLVDGAPDVEKKP